ncbi:unnamed protein product, partial [Arabidopsis halleri]
MWIWCDVNSSRVEIDRFPKLIYLFYWFNFKTNLFGY